MQALQISFKNDYTQGSASLYIKEKEGYFWVYNKRTVYRVNGESKYKTYTGNGVATLLAKDRQNALKRLNEFLHFNYGIVEIKKS